MKKTLVLLLAVVLAVGSCCNRHRLEPVDWIDFESRSHSLTPEITALLDVSVTVRTEVGESISVFDQRIGTDGDQEWIYGFAESEALSPFRTANPDRLLEYLRWATGFEEAAPGLPKPEPDRDRGAWDALPDGWNLDDPVPEIYFDVNGFVIGVKPHTTHEGWLERIHIDAPEGRSGDDVTVVTFYSRSASPSALIYPREKCIWCGNTQVCGASPECP